MQGPPQQNDAATRHEDRPSRTLTDREGMHWTVYEQAFSDYDRRTGRSLIFESDGAVRRVRNYPENWLTLDADELMLVSWKS
jgi:hypothetical protein